MWYDEVQALRGRGENMLTEWDIYDCSDMKPVDMRIIRLEALFANSHHVVGEGFLIKDRDGSLRWSTLRNLIHDNVPWAC